MYTPGLSDSGLIVLAQSLKASKLQEQVGTAVAAMANKQAEQQGENALQLIASASPIGSLGHNVDMMA